MLNYVSHGSHTENMSMNTSTDYPSKENVNKDAEEKFLMRRLVNLHHAVMLETRERSF